MRNNQKNIGIIIAVFVLFLISITIPNLSVRAQVNKSINFNQNFTMVEFSTIYNDHQNQNNFDISLPSALWTVNSVDLNFSEITFSQTVEFYENKTYGSNYELYYQNVNRKNYGVAIHLNLSNPTIIYGAYIYANKSATAIEPQVQIRGYDDVLEQPNNTIFASKNFNVSSGPPDWYWQGFSSPLSLSSGNYFLVLNGSAIGTVSSERFYWYSNNLDPKFPSLRVLEYEDSWQLGTQGVPLFKLVQKVNLQVYPEEIEMKLQINQDNYSILNGSSEGKGFLKLSELGYFSNSDTLNFPVFNNISESLDFNATSKIEIQTEMNSPANLQITENQPNEWTITPTILRKSQNCSVQFDYPQNWENIVVSKDDIDITSQVEIDQINKEIVIPNETITLTSDWEITANSPSFNFSLNVPKTEFEIGQDLVFALGGTPREGNYTFILYDITDVALEPITKQIPPDDEGFSFPISEDFFEGNYRAVVFWNNQTDGGVTSQVFSIVLANTVGPEDGFLLMLGLILGITAILAVLGYVGFKKIYKRREYSLEKILTQCVDVSNINLIIIMDKKSGVDLFSMSFSGKKVEPTLISGFLQAIRNFGAEISEDSKESRTLKLEYKDSILLMNEFVNLRIIVSMKENPSRNFLFSVDDLAFEIYKNYGDEIDNFRGNVKKFRGIEYLIEKHLGVSFIQPLKIIISEEIKLSLAEKQMVEKAQHLLEEHSMDTFYSIYLLPENECSPRDYKTIVSLIEKGVFQPQKSY